MDIVINRLASMCTHIRDKDRHWQWGELPSMSGNTDFNKNVKVLKVNRRQRKSVCQLDDLDQRKLNYY